MSNHNQSQVRSKRSRIFGLAVLIAFAVMIAMIAWAYTVAEKKIH